MKTMLPRPPFRGHTPKISRKLFQSKASIDLETSALSIEEKREQRSVHCSVCFLILILDSILDSILMHNTRLIDAKRWGLERWEDGLYGKRKGIFVN